MKVEVREIHVITAELDPMAVVRAFPNEWRDFLGGVEEYDAEDVLEFAKESFHECGADIFLDVVDALPEHVWMTQVDFS